MNPLEEVKNLIESQLENSKALVFDMTGTMDHLEIFVGCDKFQGMGLIDQHQLIMDILKESLKDKIHAVKIKTMNIEKFQNKFEQGE